MAITSETQVRDIAVEYPAAIPVLERFGIDYCCGGKHTLAEACRQHGVEIAPILEELERGRRGTSLPDVQWQNASFQDLTQYIVDRHHAFARKQLDLARNLSTKVEHRHGDKHPEISKVSTAIAAIGTELTHHFFCEENILFPYLVKLESDSQTALPPVFGSVEQPVTRMMMDHDQTGNELRLIREITGDYQLPADACTTYSALYRALEDLEKDLHLHIHLENNILFPRALAQAKEKA